MTALDWLMIGLYFASIFGVTWWVVLQNKNTSEDYFLAGRDMGWFLVGTSIFASNIGSEHLVGLAGSGCTDGVTFAHYELHAWCLLVLGWLLVPFYAHSMVFTMPEFLEKRFSRPTRLLLSSFSLVAYVITKIAVGIFAGGVVFSTLLPEVHLQLGPLTFDSFWIGSVAVIILTGLYTVLGGLRAVAYTDALQSITLVIGSGLATFYGLKTLGGWSELRTICGSEMFNLWKPFIPEGVEAVWEPVKTPTKMAWYFNSAYPWVGMLLCSPIIGLWYWCTDQYIVQRVLSAPNQTQARRGTICAAFLKLLPVIIFIVPGMIVFALAKSGKVEALAGLYDQNSGQVVADKAQSAFPLLVMHALPPGVRGMVVAGLLAALMSSLAGVFNASSTLFTMDLYKTWNPLASQSKLVWIGRVATVVLVVIGLLWIPVIRGSRGLYDYLQGAQSYFGPPIFVVFFFGVFFRRMNAAGCLAALIVGMVLGLFRLAIDSPVSLKLAGFENGYREGSWLWIINNIYFQYYSVLILIASAVTMVAVSLATAPPPPEKISGMTFSTITPELREETRNSWNAVDVVTSLLVLAVIAFAYIYFSG